MKKKIVVIMALCLAMLLVGCSSKSETSKASEPSEPSENNSLILISRTTVDGLYVKYLYDKETKVMYMAMISYYGISITPLYNADGTLRLYKEEVDEDD